MEKDLKEKLKKLKDLIYSANAAIASAKDIIAEFVDWNDDKGLLSKVISSWALKFSKKDSDVWEKFIEWIFNWEKMIDSEWFAHPIPANYVSKSKLVEWDMLKLIVWDDGKLIYKQIKPVPRKHLVWTLTMDNEQYRVIASWKTYKVILAAITYFKANIWDRVSIIVPENLESEWAAFDAVLPNTD